MRLVEEPLLHAMLQAQHDPDRIRAYRDYPFVLRPVHAAPGASVTPMGLTLRPQLAALGEELAGWSRRARLMSTPIAPCCVQPCC
jgi:hypothetical protein